MGSQSNSVESQLILRTGGWLAQQKSRRATSTVFTSIFGGTGDACALTRIRFEYQRLTGIAMLFGCPCPVAPPIHQGGGESHVVDHMDGDRTNNNAWNFQWLPHGLNVQLGGA